MKKCLLFKIELRRHGIKYWSQEAVTGFNSLLHNARELVFQFLFTGHSDNPIKETEKIWRRRFGGSFLKTPQFPEWSLAMGSLLLHLFLSCLAEALQRGGGETCIAETQGTLRLHVSRELVLTLDHAEEEMAP